MQATFIVMLLALLFPSPHLGVLSDIGQVLKDNHTARGGILHNAATQDMIAVPVEASPPARQLLEVSCSGLRSFGLEFPADTKVATIHFFPVLIPEELTSARDGWPVQAKVHPDDFCPFREHRFRNRDDHMQPELALTGDKVSSGNLVPCILLTPMRNREGKSQLAGTP